MKTAKQTRNYSVIIVSDATSSNKEFTVSSKLVKNAVLAFSFLLLFFGFIIFHYLTMTLDKQKMKRLEFDAKDKQQKISELSSTIEVLNERLKNMEIYKERIMVATGLTSPLALKEVGSGGPEFGNAGSNFLSTPGVLPDPPSLLQKDTAPKAADIRDKAQKIEDSLKSVEKFVNQQKLQLAATPVIWPTRGYISGVFGNRVHPFTGRYEFHYAIDIATQLGNKVIAPADGVVLVAEPKEYYGKMIIIDHGFGYVTRYGHLSGFNVREGQRVNRYDVIGSVGTTGRSNGPHLHYEVRYFDKPMNPADFILDSQ
ncbi:MAG: M23 family metallopeptidase [Acidobacteria bacterium]|nr:M23 family metallopeptidase [Acidobacteriota bacterium]MBU4308091.1 M23 family metallopeptidase [Acidobacteriota bacterium]MCG2811512.1 M23 family metallopeptidase [Candidatus Aminicenantes bacterium]